MTKLETIPADEGATLLPQKPQSTGGIRRVVIHFAAVASQGQKIRRSKKVNHTNYTVARLCIKKRNVVIV